MITKNKLIKLWTDTSLYRLPAETSDIVYKDTVFSATETRILKYIDSHPGIASVDLSRISGRTRGTVSLIMKKLVSLGLCEFRDDPFHRKRKLIYLTADGHRLALKRKKADEKQIENVLSSLEEKYSTDDMKLITEAVYHMLSSSSPY